MKNVWAWIKGHALIVGIAIGVAALWLLQLFLAKRSTSFRVIDDRRRQLRSRVDELHREAEERKVEADVAAQLELLDEEREVTRAELDAQLSRLEETYNSRVAEHHARVERIRAARGFDDVEWKD